MSKVLIDRELAERVCHVDNSTRQTARRELRTILATPSGTPAMPVKAYYHEVPNEYGGLNKSVGLEVRKAFIDAPLVLESDALARVACLEGEIAKRDARVMGLESQYQRDVYGLNNEGDPIGGEPAGGYANDNARLRSELAAIKAQEPVAYDVYDDDSDQLAHTVRADDAKRVAHYRASPGAWRMAPLYAAPVSEAKAQGVVMPERWNVPRPMWKDARQPYGNPLNHADIEAAEKFNLALDEVARLNAAPVQQVSVPTWMASSRAFADRLYMAGWRDHADAQHSGVAGMYDELLSSSPAAPAADAPSVEMVQAACAAFRMDISPMLAMHDALCAALAAYRAHGVV